MNLLRRLFLSLLASILSASLVGLAWSGITVATIHNRNVVKSWFDKSDFYSKIVDVVLEKAKASGNSTSSLPINDPKLQAIAKQALSPDFLKTSVNSVVDGGYNWLDGSTSNVNFKIDLTTVKQQLADGVGTYVNDRVAALPLCAGNTDSQNFDSFNATCRPAGLSAAEAGEQAKTNLLNQDFLKNPIITADTLKLGQGDNSTLQSLVNDKKAQTTKTIYQRSTFIPLSLIVTILLLSLGIIFISSRRDKGLSRVGYAFVINGAILLLIYFAVSKAFTLASKKLPSNSDSAQATALALNFAHAVLDSIKHAMTLYFIVYLAVGIVAIVVAKVILKPRLKQAASPTPHHDDITEADAQPVTAEKPAETKSKEASDKPSKPKAPKLVQ